VSIPVKNNKPAALIVICHFGLISKKIKNFITFPTRRSIVFTLPQKASPARLKTCVCLATKGFQVKKS